MDETKLFELLNINTDEIREQIIEDVARRIADDIGRDIKAQLKAKSSAAVEELITDIVCDVAEKTFQPVNHWGEEKGEPTSIKDMMVKAIDQWWQTKVDSNGKVSGGYSNKLTRAEYYAQKVVKEHVDYTLQGEMKKIVLQGKEKVRDAMSKAIAEQIKKIW